MKPSEIYRNVSTYLVTHITVTIFWVFFRFANAMTVIGHKNVGQDRNTLLVSNHQSMIDSFLVGIFAFYPQSWLKPHLMPWNPAAVENFYKNPVLAWLADRWRCVPVKTGRRDLRALHRMIQLMPTGVMTVFPEARRTRTGDVGQGKPGAAMLILKTRPKVIPVAIDGMQDVLPIGHRIPRPLKRICVYYGEPLDYSEYLDKPVCAATAVELTERIMEQIREQHDALKRLRRRAGVSL